MNKHFRSISLIFIVLFSMVQVVCAQTPYKKSTYMKDIKANMKAMAYNKVLDNVKTAFKNHPEDATIDPEFYSYSVLANYNLALEEEKKMYLKQRADTTRYFDYIYAIFTEGLTYDSLSNIPNKKGRVVNAYHKDLLLLFEKNMAKLVAGTKFSFLKKDYARAYDYADMFITLNGDSSAYAVKSLPNLQADINAMSTFTVLSAYAQNDCQKAIVHIDNALNESNRREQLLEVACRCYKTLNDLEKYEKSLLDGIEKYASNKYFFLSLVKLYNDQQRYTDVLAVTTDMLKIDDKDRDLWFIRGKEEAYLNKTDDALQSFIKATEIKTDDAESYSAIGNIYLGMSHKTYEQQSGQTGESLQTLKTELKALYTKAKNAFENARKYEPNNTTLWLSGLKELYFKLNMGKELKAIESIQ